MNMRSNFLFTVVIVCCIAAAGCGGSEPTANGSNSNSANAASQPASGEVLETTKKPEAATSNNAPTLAPVVHAYYDALRTKDAAAVRKIMAADFLRTTEADMKAENRTDIVAFLTEFDKLPENKMEVRNEQITGNRGVAQVKGGVYSDWANLVFVNEGGGWKISNEFAR